jgi:hypothetical protein
MNNLNKALILIVAYTIYYIILYFTAYTPVYIEGDDASTILYHLAGRDNNIQPPYSPYHSGFDFLLSFIPNNEKTLIQFGILISFIFGYISISLTSFWILRKLNYGIKSLISLIAIPIIVPEVLFNSLVMNPTNIGFAFCMLAMILSDNYVKSRNPIYHLIIPCLYLVGIPFRWSLELFFIVPLWSYLWSNNFSIQKLLIDKGYILLTTSSIILSFIGIYISGYTPQDVVNVLIWGKEFSDNQTISVFSIIAHNINFITPSFIMLFVIGSYFVFKQKNYKISLIYLINLIPFLLVGMFPCYKFYIMTTPFLFLILCIGFNEVSSRWFAQFSIILLIITPWIFGLKLNIKNNVYGPGFEIANWDNLNMIRFIKNPDKRKNEVENFKISTSGGMALSTMEGPRPLFGIGSVLLFGKWRALTVTIENERVNTLENVTQTHKTIIQDRATNYAQCELYRLNYRALSKFNNYNDSIRLRLFVNRSYDTIKLLVPKFKQDNNLIGFWERQGFVEFDVISSYSTILNANMSPFLTRKGPFTATYWKP